jgi:hypothetical protein
MGLLAAAAPGSENRQMERVVTRVKRSKQVAADLAFWRSRPVAERLAAVELLRRQALGITANEDAEPRLQGVCRIAQRSRG